MPYQTRRISVNLESLGIQLPQSRAAHSKSPPDTSDSPPHKRIKRSHTLDNTASIARPRVRKVSSSVSGGIAQPTPPPSPKRDETSRVDKQGIRDDIVVAVLEQLEMTGNRPHMIKELATTLYNTLPVVASSQNPIAIVSSRLTNYLKRPWTALAPCPLVKEQVAVHPRRVYYYLTTIPRLEIPEMEVATRHIISPSISSGASGIEEEGEREFVREHLSPSPELELSDVDDLPDYEVAEQPKRPVYDVLEHDEREFSKTAGVLLQRKESESRARSPQTFAAIQEEEDTEDARQRAAADLFGHTHNLDFGTSPLLQPQDHRGSLSLSIATTPKRSQMPFLDKTGVYEYWNEMKSPEDMDLAELDDLLGGC